MEAFDNTENIFELELEKLKNETLEIEEIRNEYYDNMSEMPTKMVKRELELLIDEINTLEVEKEEIEKELLDLRNFKLRLLNILEERGENG